MGDRGEHDAAEPGANHSATVALQEHAPNEGTVFRWVFSAFGACKERFEFIGLFVATVRPVAFDGLANVNLLR